MDTSQTQPLLEKGGKEGHQMPAATEGAKPTPEGGHKAVGSAGEVPTLDASAGSKRGSEHVIGDADQQKRNVAQKSQSAEKPTAA
eukprot:EC716945.1.p2 GENE.EC716945.1~~EC716945.1.p2  ORF type:complete len:85 (+),score=23.81 EC716945.1:25-279(+)